MDTSELARRIKKYEAVPKNVLMRRTPVIMRLDGRAFHTFSRNFVKPFDEVLMKAMQDTMKYLCENIQGCVHGYTQSDEITLVLTDYKKFTSEPWFDYEVQKMCSIAAGMATLEFNRKMQMYSRTYADTTSDEKEEKQAEIYAKAASNGAMFDCRVFNLPKEEVANNLYWRQLDAMRNSIQMLGQANFRHKELQHKNCRQIKEMLLTQKGLSWDDLPSQIQRGSCCIKGTYDFEEFYDLETLSVEPGTVRMHWVIDKDIPVFKDEGREYVNSRVYIGEENE